MITAFPSKPIWHTRPRETALALALSGAAVIALAGAVNAMPSLGRLVGNEAAAVVQPEAPLATSATQLRDIAPDQAIALNAKIPVAALPAGAARPFSLGTASVESRAQALECLTSAIYYEAGQESDDGQRGVAQVILNRVRHPAFPASVCGVVYQGSTRQTGCQFTFTCDGSLARGPMIDAWDRARRNAKAMLDGAVYAPVGNATHYHANYVLPYWAASLVKTQVVGAHLFYRWAGGWGQPAAFAQRYAGAEGNAAALRRAALAVPHSLPKALLNAKTEAATVAQLDKIAGVEARTTRSGRVAMRFAEARAVTDKVKVVPYVERVSASDNLRFGLGEASVSSEPALGTKPATPAN